MAFNPLLPKVRLADDDLIWAIEADPETLSILLKNPNEFLVHLSEGSKPITGANFSNGSLSEIVCITITYIISDENREFPFVIQGIDGTDVINVRIPISSDLWRPHDDTDDYIGVIANALNTDKSPWADFLLNNDETFSINPGLIFERIKENGNQRKFNIQNIPLLNIGYTHIDRFIVSDHRNNSKDELTIYEIATKPYGLLPIHKTWKQTTFLSDSMEETEVSENEKISYVLPNSYELPMIILMPKSGFKIDDRACCKPTVRINGKCGIFTTIEIACYTEVTKISR